MDTSKTYVEMCGQAREIQRLQQPEIADNHNYWYPETWFLLRKFAREGRKEIWLPRQDQLQEMVISKLPSEYKWTNVDDLIDRFEEWFHDDGIDTELISMEQLWLAFVMWALYYKKWQDNEWRVENEQDKS